MFTVEICGPVQWRPGIFRSRVVTRVWWLWFAVARVHVSPKEYAATSWDWRAGR